MPQDAFFFGTLTEIYRSENSPYKVLSVDVDSVMLGYPEHVMEGQTLYVHYFMTFGETQTGATVIDSMVVGERYFLRGVYYDVWIAHESGMPSQFNDLFVMHPLSEVTYGLFGERNIPRAGVWYIPAPPGSPVNLFVPGLENLNEEMQWIRHSLSAVRLQTTVDMSYMRLMQPGSGARAVLSEGRWVSREDNEFKHPVVTVHKDFAAIRGLSIGDSISIGIPPDQRMGGGAGIDQDSYHRIDVESDIHAPHAHVLELEIVGTFEFVNASGMLAGGWATTLVYIPDSVLPPDVNLAENERSRRIGGEPVIILYEEGAIFSDWYTFVLNDPRDADAFVAENREALASMGFSIEFLPGVAGAQAFWDSAEAILQAVTFNLVLFSIVAVIVLVLAVFIYIRQRQRDYAIMRALGTHEGMANRQLIRTLLLFALPAVITGGFGGWLLALSEAAGTSESLPDVAQAEIGTLWLPALIVAVLVVLFIVTLISVAIRRRPILELLQVTTGIKPGKIVRSSENQTPSITPANTNAPSPARGMLPSIQGARNISSGSIFNLRFMCRHIIRQRVKTVLSVIIALFFVIALGYLQTAIENTELEIEHLYHTTVVTGEIRQADFWDSAPGRLHNNVIRQQTIEDVTPLIRSELIMACHEFAALIASEEDGTLPENWYAVAGINIEAHLTDNLHAFNTIVGINDLEQYIRLNSPRAGVEFSAFSWEPSDEVSWITNWQWYSDPDFAGMKINFVRGFYPEDFVLTEKNPVPIIINNRVMRQNGYELGDIIYGHL